MLNVSPNRNSATPLEILSDVSPNQNPGDAPANAPPGALKCVTQHNCAVRLINVLIQSINYPIQRLPELWNHSDNVVLPSHSPKITSAAFGKTRVATSTRQGEVVLNRVLRRHHAVTRRSTEPNDEHSLFNFEWYLYLSTIKIWLNLFKYNYMTSSHNIANQHVTFNCIVVFVITTRVNWKYYANTMRENWTNQQVYDYIMGVNML